MRRLGRLVVLDPNQIPRIEIAAANLASEIMFGLADAPPVGPLAEHRTARPRFIDRHDRHHQPAFSKNQAPDFSEARPIRREVHPPLPAQLLLARTSPLSNCGLR